MKTKIIGAILVLAVLAGVTFMLSDKDKETPKNQKQN